jgi:ABC-type cobalamin transport system permease subunit
MKKNAQLIWGLASIVGAVVIVLWVFRFFRRFLFWLRYQLVPGMFLILVLIGIVYLAWVIFFKKEEN